ncbi:hypothetical protein LOTGIDRAFT_169159 [Lottia gigantea]|uniref:Uncharacterized protein n=1 Tax=Lottia gigantea TaxID=225164 RepID=V4B5D4_LOTGI|nr:hypothetical protein LOTGIDRAFT_169159 [Lottia gigantea]ESO83679.1 hypothetical protein LOTGIDRAFT_169159 [Lottia gigantea]
MAMTMVNDDDGNRNNNDKSNNTCSNNDNDDDDNNDNNDDNNNDNNNGDDDDCAYESMTNLYESNYLEIGQYGIGGPFWYAAGACIQILLFSMLAVQLKTRAPGAKTFLQVIRARFGKTCHKVFCCFALATNIIVTSMLMLGGAAVITSLVEGMSVEYATMLVAMITGAYTVIGGLGATFYVSYFNTAIIYIVTLIFLTKVYHDDDVKNPLGSVEKVYNLVYCNMAPEGNQENSYFTIISTEGLMFGIINIIGNFGTVFVDQSYWQSAVAAKPKQGVVGFLLGGMAWFAIPFTLSTTMGLAYVALSTRQGQPLLSEAEVGAGLVPPIVAQSLLGKSGELLMLVMIVMAITSTGSSEVMAVTSILIFDVYALYLKPYRLTNDTNSCILCGKSRGRMANPRDKCKCNSMTHCSSCYQDDKNRGDCKRAIKPDYKCTIHGSYRVYLDYLNGLKNWCLVIVSICIVPLTILLDIIQLNLGWVYLFMGVLIGSAVIPISLSMFWNRLTGIGMVCGSLSGTILALIVWMSVASLYEGGLGDFLINTGKEIPMLCGNLTSILAGGLITVVVSLITNRHYDAMLGREIWETTRDIDNPLNPWTETFAKELNLSGAHQLDNRPSLEEVTNTFKYARYLAVGGSLTLTGSLIFLWPSIMVAVEVMDLSGFSNWVALSDVWAYLATVSMIVIPLINEIYDVFHALKSKQQRISTHDERLIDVEKHVKSRNSLNSSSPRLKKPHEDNMCINTIEKIDKTDEASPGNPSTNNHSATSLRIDEETNSELRVTSGYIIPEDTPESKRTNQTSPIFD